MRWNESIGALVVMVVLAGSGPALAQAQPAGEPAEARELAEAEAPAEAPPGCLCDGQCPERGRCVDGTCTLDGNVVEPLGPDYTVAIASLVGLGGAFVATVVAALVFGDGIDISVVPAAGPFIKFGQDVGDDGLTLGTALYLASGVSQVTAIATTILGFVLAEPPECPAGGEGAGEAACAEPSFAVRPVVSPGSIGLGAGGRF